MKQKHFIDIHKGLNSVFILFLMYFYSEWDNQIAWIYLALHGTYGFLWITKSKIFPDKQWENKASIFYGFFIWLGLTLYWVSPYIIVSGVKILPFTIKISPLYLFSCIVLYIIGVFLHFTSDMQKYTYLQLRPGKLINNGMFLKSRNTNYLGELLIYLSFALMSHHWIPIVVLVLFMIIIWIPNMRKKDKSLSRYSEYGEYKKRSSLFIPFIGLY